MRILATVILVASSMEVFATPFDGDFSIFDSEFSTFENELRVKKSYHQELLETDVEYLSPSSKAVHESALSVFRDPSSDKYKRSFLNHFPKSFDTYLDVFHSRAFDQLYDGFVYIHLLHELSNEYPTISGKIIVDLASEACFDADAPNYLRHTLKSFQKSHPIIYDGYYEKLSSEQRENIEKFETASIHDGGEGTCYFKH